MALISDAGMPGISDPGFVLVQVIPTERDQGLVMPGVLDRGLVKLTARSNPLWLYLPLPGCHRGGGPGLPRPR